MLSNHLGLCHPFSFCLQSFPASRSLPMSQLFESGGQRIGASASVFPVNIQGWFSLGLTGLIFLQCKGLSKAFSGTTVWKTSVLPCSAFFMVQLSHTWLSIHDYWKNHRTIQISVAKVMSLWAQAILPQQSCDPSMGNEKYQIINIYVHIHLFFINICIHLLYIIQNKVF